MAPSLSLSHSLTASFRLQPPAKSLAIPSGARSSPSLLGFQGSFLSNRKPCHWDSSINSKGSFRRARMNICCSMNMSAGKSDDDEDVRMGFKQQLVSKAREVWDSCPEPVRSFPWDIALINFIQLQVYMILSVVKYLSVPLLLITTISEMSYCAHERKLFLIVIPLFVGYVLAGLLRDTAMEMSSVLKTAEVPWHLFLVAMIFALIKLPGPYYPYWGRLLIPHLANGVLWRTVWFTFLWFRRPRNASGELISS
ncbi:hypothetical protein LINGRAHAP2_LOCUS12783 [Linum grandiflorum]